jgi:hypothetical protein
VNLINCNGFLTINRHLYWEVTYSTHQARTVFMSAEEWLRAANTEEERLLDELAKTILYKRLEAVRTVIALYQGRAEPPKTSEQPAATVGATKQNGQTSRHSFKAANPFSDLPDAVADAGSRQRTQP